MKRFTTALLLSGLLASGLTSSSTAGADPIADKRAEAERVARELDELGRRTSIVTEELNVARLKASKIETEAAEAALAAAKAEVEAQAARAQLRTYAVNAYVSGGFTATAGRMKLTDANAALTGQHYLGMIARDKAAAIDSLNAATAELKEKQTALEEARRESRQALDAVDARRDEAARAAAAERRTLSQVQGELAGLVEAERARREEAEARKAQELAAARRAQENARRAAPPAPSGGSGSPPAKAPSASKPTAPTGPPPPSASGAAGAVEEAKRHIGKPYQWGGSGPDTFDCSGLTSYAWRHGGGKSLPHSSRAQYSSTTRISMDDLAPGDLLFYGPNVEGIHHVGIYAGGGQMVEAPETGKNVRYGSIHRRDLVGIGRVR